MRLASSKPYTILITRSGRSPITVRLYPKPVAIALASTLILPMIWVGNTIHSLRQQNDALAHRNGELSQSAVEVLEDLEALDSEIDDLRERAGLPEQEESASPDLQVSSQGGPRIDLDGEHLFGIAKVKLPALSSRLNWSVKPALEKTLDQEADRKASIPQGNPLRIAPEISSEFGARQSPFGRNYEFHNGIDFIGPIGTPIYSTAKGTVKRAEFSGGYGYHVVIDHGYNYRTLYAHMSKMAVEPGTQVRQGTLIGYLGSTGRSSGPHLHYSVFLRDKAINPKVYLALGQTDLALKEN